jgi:toxin ParE1/3/4
MAYHVVWSPTATLDLKELHDFIAEDNPAAATGFVNAIFEAIERLPSFPHSGRIVPEFCDPEIREIIQRPCRIVYLVKERPVEIQIARVWYAARGIPEL